MEEIVKLEDEVAKQVIFLKIFAVSLDALVLALYQ